MTVKTKLTALVVATCFIVAGSLGIIAWAFAAANVGISSTLSVTYEASPHVVGTVDATYQKTKDASATAFKSGTITMNYGDSSGSRTLTASDSALALDDSNTYVVFEFKFYNNNPSDTMGITITLTDNGICSNMTRKYYFGNLTSKTIAEKESTIKSSGVENSALSTQSVTIGQGETTYVYMLLEITPGVIASYNSNSTNKFLFSLASKEVTPTVSYLSADWQERLISAAKSSLSSTNLKEGASERELLSENILETTPNISQAPIVGVDSFGDLDVKITLTHTASDIQNYSNRVSVGTNSATSTDAYIQSDSVCDVTLAWEGEDYGENADLTLVFYSPVEIYAPRDSTGLFSCWNIDDSHIVATCGHQRVVLTDSDFSELNISLVQTFTSFFGSYHNNITYPANFPEEYK